MDTWDPNCKYSIYFTLIRKDFEFPYSAKYENTIHAIYRRILRDKEDLINAIITRRSHSKTEI